MPIGALVELGVRLVGMSIDMPVSVTFIITERESRLTLIFVNG